MKSVLSIGRRAALLGAASALIATVALPVAASEPHLIRVGAPFGAVPGIKTAIEEGLFEEAGIEIEIVTLSGGPNILAATVGGSVDVGYADLFAWVGARANGFDLTLIQSANGRGNTDYIIAGADSGIVRPEDLRGRTIGTAAHAQSRLRVALYLERFGIESEEVEYVIINARETVGAALSSGQIDAAIAADPNVVQWEQQYGVIPLEGRPWEQIPEGATTAGYFVTDAWLEANPELAATFVRIAREGAVLYQAYSPEEKANIVRIYSDIDLIALDAETPGVLQRIADDNAAHTGPIDLEATTEWLRTAEAHGVISEAIDIAPLLHWTATAESLELGQ